MPPHLIRACPQVAIERDFTDDEIATVKAWLVSSAKRLERIARSRNQIG